VGGWIALAILEWGASAKPDGDGGGLGLNHGGAVGNAHRPLSLYGAAGVVDLALFHLTDRRKYFQLVRVSNLGRCGDCCRVWRPYLYDYFLGEYEISAAKKAPLGG